MFIIPDVKSMLISMKMSYPHFIITNANKFKKSKFSYFHIRHFYCQSKIFCFKFKDSMYISKLYALI